MWIQLEKVGDARCYEKTLTVSNDNARGKLTQEVPAIPACFLFHVSVTARTLSFGFIICGGDFIDQRKVSVNDVLGPVVAQHVHFAR